MLDVGTIPRSVTVILENNLVDTCQVVYSYLNCAYSRIMTVLLLRKGDILRFCEEDSVDTWAYDVYFRIIARTPLHTFQMLACISKRHFHVSHTRSQGTRSR